MIYNAFVSPLSLIPGPKLCTISEFSVASRRPEGRVFEWFYQLHRKYGNVVRVGPKFILCINNRLISKGDLIYIIIFIKLMLTIIPQN